MKKTIKLLIFIPALILTTACSTQLEGTWTVAQYESISPGQKNVTLQNIGTMTYNSDGTGEKHIKFTVFATMRSDTMPFRWKSFGDHINIESQNSELAKAWIIIKSKNKYQKWESTDGSYSIQVLELERKTK